MRISFLGKPLEDLRILIFQGSESKADCIAEISLPWDIAPAAALQTLCDRVAPLPQGAYLGYKMKGDAVRPPARGLKTVNDMSAALSVLQGKVKRSHGVEKHMRVEILVRSLLCRCTHPNKPFFRVRSRCLSQLMLSSLVASHSGPPKNMHWFQIWPQFLQTSRPIFLHYMLVFRARYQVTRNVTSTSRYTHRCTNLCRFTMSLFGLNKL
jgi:hypothetical protein